jgi:putative DNA primase/helicase
MPPMSDSELLTMARSAVNGDRFSKLFDIGDWHHAYPSQSEADLALCAHLNFWTGGDVEQLDRLFRQSALMRPKWDEPRGACTYGERTLARALGGL